MKNKQTNKNPAKPGKMRRDSARTRRVHYLISARIGPVITFENFVIVLIITFTNKKSRSNNLCMIWIDQFPPLSVVLAPRSSTLNSLESGWFLSHRAYLLL